MQLSHPDYNQMHTKRPLKMHNQPPKTIIRRTISSFRCKDINVLVALCLVVLPLALNSFNLVIAVGQDFEDLSKETFGNVAPVKPSTNQQNVFQSRQQPQSTSSSTSSTRQFMQRPNRFLPSSTQQQQSVAQESSSQMFPAASSSQQQQSVAPAPSNIEQMMRNALSRNAQMSPEPRQDLAPRNEDAQPQVSPNNGRQGASGPSTSAATSFTPTALATTAASSTAAANDRIAESPASQASGLDSGDDEKQTTSAALASTTDGHDTVYSDQRFANLFARRGANKKSRIQPHEQVKAKPTLPSFIKSPPDPKQFASQAQASGQDGRGSNQQAGNSFVSQRIQQQQQQQQNQARINAQNQQKKPIITSSSATNANNKRNNSLSGKQISPALTSSSAKSTTASPKVASTTSKPITQFNRVNSDPASVIAMARKRLLANNALESGKLKLQQQNKPSTN